MEGFSAIIIHGGEWVMKESREEYIGGQCIVLRLRQGDDLQGLEERIDKYRYALSIKYFFRNDIHLPTVRICDDEDLEEFMNMHIEDKQSKPILYISHHVTDTVPSTCISNNGVRGSNTLLYDSENHHMANGPTKDGGNTLNTVYNNDSTINIMNCDGLGLVHVDNTLVDLINCEQHENIQRLPTNDINDHGFHGVQNSLDIAITDQNIVPHEQAEGHTVYESSSPVVNVVDTHALPSSTGAVQNDSSRSSRSMFYHHIEHGLSVGRVFDFKSHLVTELGIYAIRNQFETRSSKSKSNLVVIKCAYESCNWKIRATKVLGSESFKVTIFNNVHTCDPNKYMVKNRTATSKVLANAMKMKLLRPGRVYKPKDIIEDCREEFGIKIGYTTAYRSKEKALNLIRGTAEESFMKLPSYCHILTAKNPGTVTHIEVDTEGRFKYFFMALGPSLRGFRSCMRHVITIDGAFLSGRYAGTLFVAATSDGNSNTYPIAMGIRDSENNESWEWFLSKLSGAIGVITDLVIISDRHPSIIQAVPKAFPNAFHGFCAFHMELNLNNRFKNPDIIPLFLCCARAYTRREFEKYFSDLNMIDPAITDYLINAGKEKWSRHYCQGMRYGIMTTNISESFNNVMRAAREMPITMLAEYYLAKLQEWFVDRSQKALKWEDRYLTEDAESITRQNRTKSSRYRVVRINAYIYQVIHGDSSDEVDLLNKSCTCKEFDIHRIPCSHAIAAARFEGIEVYSLVDKKYTAECYLLGYSEAIFPASDQGEWEVPKDIAELVNEPPQTKVKSGKPRKRRIRSRGEDIRKITLCSRCRRPGHNRATCTVVLQMIVDLMPANSI